MDYSGFCNAEKLNNFFHAVKKRYCLQTAKTYCSVLEKFFKWIKKDFSRISNQDVEDWLEIIMVDKQYSSSYYNQFISAFLKFNSMFYNRRFKSYILQRPVNNNTIPDILSQEEIIQLIFSIKNKKHRAIIAFIYAHGLRISECINFTIDCFDKERGLILIKQAKGKKDRLIPFSDSIKEILTDYYLHYKPSHFFFEGENGPYSKTSIRNILNKAVKNAGIKKHVHVHTLRHSYATHLHEQGYDIADIQKLLGHSRIETTQIYAHISTRHLKSIILKTFFRKAC